jgi:hypothetical protein
VAQWCGRLVLDAETLQPITETVLEEAANRDKFERFAAPGMKYVNLKLTPDNLHEVLGRYLAAGDLAINLTAGVDAIEIMERDLPDAKPAANLWIEAADVIKRSVDSLPSADRELWRRVGKRLGFDEATISDYLPPYAAGVAGESLLSSAGLKHVAIVCLREQQAKQAAEEISSRSGAKVTVVTATTAGSQTTQACTADVVLFVWLASTHAVFRAFDGFDRQRFCYVQGTGSSSIVKALERWLITV